MKILSSKQLVEADQATIKSKGITSEDLMEHAAGLCFNWLQAKIKLHKKKLIHVFCGIGNNGGDGLVIARYLYQLNYNVACYVVNFSNKRSKDFLSNYNRIKEIGLWPVVIEGENQFPAISNEDLVVDAIFGNGLNRTPEDFTKNLIQHINKSEAFVLSIDFPSGLFADTSVIKNGVVIKASHTLTFQTPKLAFLQPENHEFTQTWEVVDIGLDLAFIDKIKSTYYFTTKEDIRSVYQPRTKFSHKGTYGHSLIIGGSFGKIGAVTLAASAALTAGSGLVSAYVPKCGYEILQISIPEVMVEVDNDKTLQYFNFKTRASVIGIGMGMGTNEKTADGFREFLKQNKLPLIIDADGLNLLAKNNSLLAYLPENTILTPHPKELERLLGKWTDDYDKLLKAREFSQKNNVILVIKGAHSVVVDGMNCYFNSSGNSGLATAGSGDVLTGIITGLIAQQYSPLNAALFGVYLHGRTADIGVYSTGIESFTATSIIDFISDAYLDLLTEETGSDSSDKNSGDTA